MKVFYHFREIKRASPEKDQSGPHGKIYLWTARPLMEYVLDKCSTDFDHAVSLATTADSFKKFRANEPEVGAILPSANETSLLVEMVRGISEGLGLKIEHHVQTNESIHDTLTGT